MAKKKIFSTRVDEDRIKDLKHLAVDTDKSLGTLLEEAILELLKKYGKDPQEWIQPKTTPTQNEGFPYANGRFLYRQK